MVHLCASYNTPPLCSAISLTPYLSITPLSPSVISSSLIMNPTGVLFIRQARGERPASQADPATLSSLGIWHRNFNRRATQAGRSVLETHCACQSELTSLREHSKCAALWAWQSVTSVEEGREDRERMMTSGKGVVKGSRGTTLRHWGAIQVRGEGQGTRAWRQTKTILAVLPILIKQAGFLLIAFYSCKT